MQHFRGLRGWHEKTIWTYRKSWVYLTSVLKLIKTQCSAQQEQIGSIWLSSCPWLPWGAHSCQRLTSSGGGPGSIRNRAKFLLRTWGIWRSPGELGLITYASVKGKPTNFRHCGFFHKLSRKPTSSSGIENSQVSPYSIVSSRIPVSPKPIF